MSCEDDSMTLFIEEKTLKKFNTAEPLIPKTITHVPAACYGIEGETCLRPAYWRRRNTQYIDEEDNWVFMCDECFELELAYWQERWDEYYASCM